jgi:ligand-binding SRPBCC domain-containing protein
MAERGFTVSTVLAAPADRVWAHATSMRGVNRELFPLLRMTYPAAFEGLTPAEVTLGRRLFRSWILLLGVLPVEYDDLTIEELGPGHRFLERSKLLTQHEWVHERTVEPRGSGSVLTDRIRFTPRVPLLAGFHFVVFRIVFHLRHRALSRIFS